MKQLRFALVLVLAACATSASQSATNPQAADAAAEDRSPALPVDPDVRIGKLDNGLTYFIRQHKKPEKRAMLWLAVDAGSVLEDDDQQGLAHFVEHMAFNGTKRFEKNKIIDFIEAAGMKFGADVNAYTSFDETVYQLQVPTDDAKLMASGLDVLEDWASAVTFDPAEVDKERGVVIEEWRLGRGASQRAFDEQWPLMLKDSKYAERKPIGKKEILEKAPVETLKRFYDDWYRPDLMAVIAVGDFDPDQMEAEIKQRFSKLENPDQARARENVPVPVVNETRVSTFTDPEMSRTTVSVMLKGPRQLIETEADFRRRLVEQSFHGMLRARLDEMRQRPEAPFMFAFSGSSTMGRAADVFNMTAFAKNGKIQETVTTLLTEVERVRQHGFVATELERHKARQLRSMEEAVTEKDTINGRRYAFGIVRHFLQDQPMPGPAATLALAEKYFPTIELEEVNRVAETWTAREDRVVTASGPSREGLPENKALLAAIGAVSKSNIAPYQDASVSDTLMAAKPKPGSIENEQTIPELGVTVWKLSNGARVVVKPTDFKNDEVLFMAFSPGGHSLIEDKRYHSAASAGEIVAASGTGQHDAVALRKALAGKEVRVRPWISSLEEGLRGNASPKDIELLMQLVHLNFTAPRTDEKAFSAWMSRREQSVKNRDLNPQQAFFQEFAAASYKNHLRYRPTTMDDLGKIDLEVALDVYGDRFKDAGDFTFLFVGNVDTSQLKTLAAQYLASLPSTGRKEKWRDVKARHPNGVTKVRVNKGKDPKAFVFLTFHGKTRWSAEAEDDIKMLGEALSIRLREVLREEMSGVYGAFSRGNIKRRPKPGYEYVVGFGCAPKNVQKLTYAVFRVIDSFKKSGVEDSYIDKIKEQRRRAAEKKKKQNRFWMVELGKHYRYGTDPKGVLDIDKAADRVSSKRIQAAAKRYLNRKRMLDGLLLPEGTVLPNK